MSSNGQSKPGGRLSGSAPHARRQSQTTLASMDIPQSPFAPSRLFATLVKHGKYVAAGATGLWWLDIGSAFEHLAASPTNSWPHRTLVGAVIFHGITVVTFLYLVLYLPWFRGYIPNYPKWQESRTLRTIVPVLTTAILLGWTTLVYALKHSGRPTPGGTIRDAVRGALNVPEREGGLSLIGAMAGATALYTMTFGLLGLIPTPNVPVRAKED